ncbi:RGS domain-containing protein [Catenaria anguillulae PL171]|uniref:RGS domain-containing protein n=1 Tax=Catenaria anguillulae PL171 TaxID=765915 RepID=A0A1Y2HN62_9FUNG|nr:RGS domain-containing protein [Catenaria anguillulae PL171]
MTPRGLFHEDDIIHNRWYQGNTRIYHIVFPLFLSFGVYVPIGLAWSGCFSSSTFPHCLNNPATYGIAYYPQFISLVAWFPAVTFLLNVLRRVPDRLLLVAEHVVHYFIFVVGVILYWILHFVQPPDGSGGTIRTLALWVVVTLSLLVSTSLPALLAVSNHLSCCNGARRSSMQQTTESFQRLLADKELFSQFKKVLAEHFSLENGLFWDDFRELEQMNAAKKPDQSIREALNRLYLEYVPPGAPRELNLMSRTREAVISDFNNNRLTIRSFDPVKKEVFDMMYSHSLPQFLQQQQLLHSSSGAPGSSSAGRAGMGKRRSVAMASP